jgi:hypothetical protein
MLRWKLAVLLLMSLWLPLQGVAAVVMPFCKHSLVAGTEISHAAHETTANGEHSGHHGHHHDGQSSGDGGKSAASACDDCGHCHLSCASTLPAAELRTSVTAIAAGPYSIQPALAGIVPHHLKRPPLLA